jgi:glycerol-3-phosphate dehydrogenase
VQDVRQEANGFIVNARDELDGHEVDLNTDVVINAAGAWAGEVSGEAGKIRPLRGSHLFLRHDSLPVDDCVTVLHPQDKRPVFIFPWLGMTCVGTTDLDHPTPLSEEPSCTAAEIDYLFELINSQFPDNRITRDDVVSTLAGVRPVIASGKGLDPSKESREHSVWKHNGIVSVAGGKLTTFRLIALDALLAAGLIDGQDRAASQDTRDPMFRHSLRFPHRLGHPTAALPDGDALLDTLQWVVDNEMVCHLDDLMLRRVRLGNTRPAGGQALLPQVRAACQRRLGWDDARWEAEEARYVTIVERYYGLPASGNTP